MSTWAAMAAVFVVGAALAVPAPAQQRPPAVEACALALRVPVGWVVVPDERVEAPKCGFLLRPSAWDSILIASDSVDVFTVLVRTSEASFSASVEDSPFEYADGTWWVGGRHGQRNVAQGIAGEGWRGIVGRGPFGCYRLGGGYVGACESPVALLGTSRRSAILEGGPDDVFGAVLLSVRFLR